MKPYSLTKIHRTQDYIHARGSRKLHGKVQQIKTQNDTIEILIYENNATNKDYAVIEVHGGGFMYNTARDDDDFCFYIHSQLGIPVVSCDYRLAPEYGFPHGLNDISACVEYTKKRFDLPEKHIILWGHSAGANLVAGASYRDKNTSSPSIGFQILDYPYMDTYLNSKDRVRIRGSVPGRLMDTFSYYYASNDVLKNPLVSPVLMSRDQLVKMPHTFLLLCGRDNLNQAGKAYGELLKAADNDVTLHYEKEALHGFVENHFNYIHIPVLTKLQNGKNQRKLAVNITNKICHWIQHKITVC